MSGGGGGSGNGGGGGPPGGGDPGMTTAPSHAPPGEKGGGGYVAPAPSGPSPHVDRGGPVTYTTQQYDIPDKPDVPSTESLLSGDVNIFEGTKEVIPTRGPMGDEMWDTKPDVPNEVKGGENLGTSVINPHFDSPAIIEEQKNQDTIAKRVVSTDDRDFEEQAVGTPFENIYEGPAVDVATIHGETGDPGSVTYDPTMTPDKLAAQEVATKKAIYGTGKRAGDLVIDPKTGEGTFVQDYTFKEHWDNAIIDHPALKFSPSARLLYATGKNIAEFATEKGLLGFDRDVNDPSGEGPAGGASAGGNYGGNVNPLQEYAGREYKDQPYASSTPSGGDGGDSVASLITAPQTPYIVTGNTPASNSVAANWYYGLGQTSTNPGGFNLATEYAAAKTKVAQTLGTPSSYGWLAVNNSPFYNWLKTNSLDKGIL